MRVAELLILSNDCFRWRIGTRLTSSVRNQFKSIKTANQTDEESGQVRVRLQQFVVNSEIEIRLTTNEF